MAEVYHGRDDYAQDEKNQLKDTEDWIYNVEDGGPKSGQIVHCEVDAFMMAFVELY